MSWYIPTPSFPQPDTEIYDPAVCTCMLAREAVTSNNIVLSWHKQARKKERTKGKIIICHSSARDFFYLSCEAICQLGGSGIMQANEYWEHIRYCHCLVEQMETLNNTLILTLSSVIIKCQEKYIMNGYYYIYHSCSPHRFSFLKKRMVKFRFLDQNCMKNWSRPF